MITREQIKDLYDELAEIGHLTSHASVLVLSELQLALDENAHLKASVQVNLNSLNESVLSVIQHQIKLIKEEMEKVRAENNRLNIVIESLRRDDKYWHDEAMAVIGEKERLKASLNNANVLLEAYRIEVEKLTTALREIGYCSEGVLDNAWYAVKARAAIDVPIKIGE